MTAARPKASREQRAGPGAKGQEGPGPSDVELVARCRAGDARAWETIVLRYRRLVYAIPMRTGLAPEEADDVFQNTFARLVERLDTLRDPSRLRAWLVTTARRLSLDAAMRRRGLAESEEVLGALPDPDPLPPEELARLEEQHLVRCALTELPDRCRELLHLLYYAADEPSYEEIGRRLGLPMGSIGPTRARCLEKLLHRYRALTAEDGGGG